MQIKKLYILTGLLTFQANTVLAEPFWYLKPTVGISQMGDKKGQTVDLGSVNGTAEIELDGGFTPGLSFGYNFGNQWATEFGWEYRSNDSQTTLADGTFYPEGNYASNVFFLNGYYHFNTQSKWQPYIGAGLMFSQEIDIDLELDGVELSYTADGDTGFQIMGGVTYAINNDWSLNGEIRYGSFSGIDLTGEGNIGQINDLDYDPLTIGMGLQYNF